MYHITFNSFKSFTVCTAGHVGHLNRARWLVRPAIASLLTTCPHDSSIGGLDGFACSRVTGHANTE
jgi:hypothetical protein